MEETKATQPTGYNVDLTCEEYVRSQMLLTRLPMPIPLRTLQLIFTAMALVMVAGIVALAKLHMQPDWSLLLMTVISVCICLLYWLVLPHRVKTRAEKLFEDSVTDEYSYFGTVYVYPDRVVKVGNSATTTLTVDATLLFVESEDCMVWIKRGQPMLILPARCMTAEAATAMRTLADRLPARNRRFFGRLQPQNQPPAKPETADPTVLWEKTMVYTAEEYTSLLKYTLLTAYRQRVAVFSVISAVAALLIGSIEERIWVCIPCFLLFFGLLTWKNLLLNWRRIPRAVAATTDEARCVTVALTDRGVQIEQADKKTTLPWGSIPHIINREDYVEILREPQSFRIPKRVIEDFAAFDRIITQYWHNKK